MEETPTTIVISDLSGGIPPPPRIFLSEILTELSVVQQQETNERTILTTAFSPNIDDIRTKMIAWVAGGMNGPCDIVRVTIAPPNICSDGISRNFFDYILFLTEKTLAENVKVFQELLPEFEVGYRCSRTELIICVVRVL